LTVNNSGQDFHERNLRQCSKILMVDCDPFYILIQKEVRYVFIRYKNFISSSTVCCILAQNMN